MNNAVFLSRFCDFYVSLWLYELELVIDIYLMCSIIYKQNDSKSLYGSRIFTLFPSLYIIHDIRHSVQYIKAEGLEKDGNVLLLSPD